MLEPTAYSDVPPSPAPPHSAHRINHAEVKKAWLLSRQGCAACGNSSGEMTTRRTVCCSVRQQKHTCMRRLVFLLLFNRRMLQACSWFVFFPGLISTTHLDVYVCSCGYTCGVVELLSLHRCIVPRPSVFPQCPSAFCYKFTLYTLFITWIARVATLHSGVDGISLAHPTDVALFRGPLNHSWHNRVELLDTSIKIHSGDVTIICLCPFFLSFSTKRHGAMSRPAPFRISRVSFFSSTSHSRFSFFVAQRCIWRSWAKVT